MSTPTEALERRLMEWSDAFGTARGRISYDVRAAPSGTRLASMNAATPRRGGSVMKLLTAVAALSVMDSRVTFATAVLRGPGSAVCLRGEGNMVITRAAMDELAKDTLAALGEYPGCLQVSVDPTAYPEPTPAVGWRSTYYPIEVRPVTPLAPDEYFGYRPAEAAGEAFVRALHRRGASVAFVGIAPAPCPGQVLARHESPTVAHLVGRMLSRSDNAVAEGLFREVARARGLAPTWANGVEATGSVLADLVPDRRGVRIVDGSGLSLVARVRADVVADLLLAAEASVGSVVAVLPLLGVEGSLAEEFGWRRPRQGSVWAKSGTLVDSAALAGVATTTGGARRVFAVLIEGLEDPGGRDRGQLQAFADAVTQA